MSPSIHISKTNQHWLANTAEQFKTEPAALLDVILQVIRTQSDSIDSSIETWINYGVQSKDRLDELHEQVQNTLEVTTEATKAAQLYLNLINRHRKRR